MRVLILGGGGMLGHKLVQTFKDRFETWVTLRSSFRDYERFNLFDPKRSIGEVDAFDFDSVVRAFETTKPDVVINAIGAVKQLPAGKDPVTALTINSLLPHKVARLCRDSGSRLITLSTDCVFSGERGGYKEEDNADGEDLYGRTKYLGEVSDENCLTLRTSIIGRELENAHSLVEWFLSNRGGSIKGYTRAIYSGFPTIVMAEIIRDMIEAQPALSGLYHVSSNPISKYELLCMLREAFGIKVEIEPDAEFQIDRSLDSQRFRKATGFQPASWTEMINKMAADPTPYDDWRSTIDS